MSETEKWVPLRGMTNEEYRQLLAAREAKSVPEPCP